MLISPNGNTVILQRNHRQGSCKCKALQTCHESSPSATEVLWRRPLQEQAARLQLPDAPAVVALGKFDALHRGHQALAAACSQSGAQPWLVSFIGMAEVLGWPARLPLVAPQERAAVLRSWAPACNNCVPQELYIPFREIRSLSPGAFVDLLAQELNVYGVVVGSNYRFGYKATGDTKALQELCRQQGVQVTVLDLVGGAVSPTAEADGIVSSTKVRDALACGHLDTVAALLGRPYKVVAQLTAQGAGAQCLSLLPRQDGASTDCSTCTDVRIPLSCICNQPPTPGTYVAEVTFLRTLSHPHMSAASTSASNGSSHRLEDSTDCNTTNAWQEALRLGTGDAVMQSQSTSSTDDMRGLPADYPGQEACDVAPSCITAIPFIKLPLQVEVDAQGIKLVKVPPQLFEQLQAWSTTPLQQQLQHSLQIELLFV